MPDDVILETQDLKQYFFLRRKRNERARLKRLRLDIVERCAAAGSEPPKFDEIEAIFRQDPANAGIPPAVRTLLEEYTWYKDAHGAPLAVKANDGVSLKVHAGETVGIVGESGCGKSTFGRALLKLYQPTHGRVIFDGKDITYYSTRKMTPLRTEMQIIFQDPYSSLDPRMTVGQIIGEALVEHGIYKKGSQELEDYVLEIMETCGLADYMIHRYPHEFSGGQRQRVGIARALALKPKLVVCDEAVSALDVSIQAQIINLLKALQRRFSMAYIFISHDLSVVKHISDRIAVMYLGKIVELADKHSLYANPLHPYTKALLSAIPITDLEAVKKRKRILLQGDLPSNVITPSGCAFHTRCPIAQDICRRVEPKLEGDNPNHQAACHFKGKDIEEVVGI